VSTICLAILPESVSKKLVGEPVRGSIAFFLFEVGPNWVSPTLF
jgi:hypothetical protein